MTNIVRAGIEQGKRSEALHTELKGLLIRWTYENISGLESAKWHHHLDTNADVLVIITKNGIVSRVIIQPMSFTLGEERIREAVKKSIAEGIKRRPGRPPKRIDEVQA